jgi:hypothetical protein
MPNPETTKPLTVEERLSRLEKWANQPSWLDQPAIGPDGEPFILSDTWPLHAKIMGAFALASGVFFVGLIVYVCIAGHIK